MFVRLRKRHTKKRMRRIKKGIDNKKVFVYLRVVHLSCVWKSKVKPHAPRGAPVFFNFLHLLTFPNPLFF